MSTDIDDAQRAVLHDQLVPDFRAMLGDGPLPDNPADLEQLAATLLVPLDLPEMPTEVGAAFLDAIEERSDEGAAGLLAAIALVAREPLAGQARAAAERLAEEGIVAPATRRLGTLAVKDAVRMDGGDAELLVATLRRPRGRLAQVAIVGIDHEETGGALVECVLTPPLPAAEARGFITGVAARDGAPSPRPIAADELAMRAVTAAQRAVETEVALSHEAATALPLLARALTGDAAGLARPQVMPPWEDDDPELVLDAAEDEDGFRDVMELLLDELEGYATATCPPDGAVWRSGDFVASSMLEWKGGYHDGRLGRWTVDDLAEYMLDYFPRKVSAPAETLADAPECAIAFLRFLADRGSLSGDPLDELEAACDQLHSEFRERSASPESWGLAKSMTMQMLAESVDLSEPAAVDAWIADFNSRPRADRDAVVGGAVERTLGGAQPVAGNARQAAPKRRSKRKAQRTARKRNRRRS